MRPRRSANVNSPLRRGDAARSKQSRRAASKTRYDEIFEEKAKKKSSSIAEFCGLRGKEFDANIIGNKR
jgi:hypothetical protein